MAQIPELAVVEYLSYEVQDRAIPGKQNSNWFTNTIRMEGNILRIQDVLAEHKDCLALDTS